MTNRDLIVVLIECLGMAYAGGGRSRIMCKNVARVGAESIVDRTPHSLIFAIDRDPPEYQICLEDVHLTSWRDRTHSEAKCVDMSDPGLVDRIKREILSFLQERGDLYAL